MKEATDGQEEAKEDDLNKETAENDAFAEVGPFLGFGTAKNRAT